MSQRIYNAKRNMLWGMLLKIVSMVLPFITRTLIIHYIGVMYLGLGGLFSSILQVLNLAELGFGSAMVFSMYKPIANQDDDTVCALLALYRRIYRVVGLIILTAGLGVMPFLRVFIKGSVPPDVNIYIIYLVQLVDTVLSYFLFAYKSSLLVANQREDVNSRISLIVTISSYCTQILVLIFTRNYYIYIGVLPLFVIARNLTTEIVTRRMFPAITCRGKLEKSITQDITKRVAGLFIYKVCDVFRNSFDSVIISAFLGLVALATYQNYFYLFTSVSGILLMMLQSAQAGIGNSIAKESVEKNHWNFNNFLFLFQWVTSVCTCCFAGLYQPFMKIWMGKEELLLSTPAMLCFCAYFYIVLSGNICFIYRQAAGLWWQDKLRPVVESVINLTLNIILVQYLGIVGVLLSTIISLLLINWGWGGYTLFKHYFKRSPVPYYLKMVKYSAVTLLASAATFLVCERISLEGFGGLFARLGVCLALSNAILLACYCWQKDFAAMKYLKKLLRRGAGEKA